MAFDCMYLVINSSDVKIANLHITYVSKPRGCFRFNVTMLQLYRNAFPVMTHTHTNYRVMFVCLINSYPSTPKNGEIQIAN